MKKLILLAFTSLLFLAINAQSNGKSKGKSELKQLENKGKDKARAVQTISTQDVKRSKQELKKEIKDKQEKHKGLGQDKKDLKQEIKADKDVLKDKVKTEKEALKDRFKTEKDNAKKTKDEVNNEFDVSDSKDKSPSLNSENKEIKANKGNGHGKNKGDLSGKEFGQERAKQAKLNKEAKKKELVNTLSEAEIKYNNGTDKVKVAKEKLEADKVAGNISEKDYLEKAERIKKAEIALEKLKSNISKSKSIQ